MKINGVEVEDCENFTMYSFFHCKGEQMCSIDPNCEFKQKKRKQAEKIKIEK